MAATTTTAPAAAAAAAPAAAPAPAAAAPAAAAAAPAAAAPAAAAAGAAGVPAAAAAGGAAAPAAAAGSHTSASLYAGNLHPEVTEALLYETFAPAGAIASIRVCRDTATRRSLGYAYINFHKGDEAERALDTLNYQPLKGYAMRLMWSQRDPSLRKSGVGNVFIKNLDRTIDDKALRDTFSAFGNILSAKVNVDEKNESKGYGYVHFESSDAAEQAIELVNGMLLNGKKVFVGFHVSRRERESKAEQMKATFTNVFIKNVDESVTQEDFQNLMKPFGAYTSIVLMTDIVGKSRGFGFVNYNSHIAADEAVNKLNDFEFHGKKLWAGRAQKKAEREEELHRKFEAIKQERMSKYQGVNLYVKNLDDTIDDEKLRTEFAPWGTITSARVITDEKGTSRGFGFVCYSSPEEATKAVTELNGKMIGNKPIYAALAQRKEVRRQQLEAQYSQRRYLGPNPMMLAASAPQMFPGGPYLGYPPNRPYYPMMPAAIRPRFTPAPAAGRPGYQAMAPAMYPGPPGGAPGVSSAARPQRQNRRIPPQQGLPSGPIPAGAGPRGPINMGPMMPQMNRMPRGYPAGANPNPAGPVVKYPAGAGPARAPAGPVADFSAALAQAGPEQQKQLIGERIFHLVKEREGEQAGKITGMLLEMDNTELLHLLDSPEALAGQIDHALRVLQNNAPKTEQA